MKITYDREADALYIRLVPGRHECRTVQLNQDVALNIGPGEVLVGIEVLSARETVGGGKAPSVQLENVAQALKRVANVRPVRGTQSKRARPVAPVAARR